jgi:hypothetical protein
MGLFNNTCFALVLAIFRDFPPVFDEENLAEGCCGYGYVKPAIPETNS